MSDFALSGRCHCGAVGWTLHQEPAHLTACNCSICRRVAALWAHAEAQQISLHYAPGTVIRYTQGDRMLAMVSCKTCGCTTHWESEPEPGETTVAPTARMAVNVRMAEPSDIERYRVRVFDGAKTWTFLD